MIGGQGSGEEGLGGGGGGGGGASAHLQGWNDEHELPHSRSHRHQHSDREIGSRALLSVAETTPYSAHMQVAQHR